MLLKSETIFSMKDANQNFSKVAKAIDTLGEAVIYKHNKPRYLIVPFDDTILVEENESSVKSVVRKKVKR